MQTSLNTSADYGNTIPRVPVGPSEATSLHQLVLEETANQLQILNLPLEHADQTAIAHLMEERLMKKAYPMDGHDKEYAVEFVAENLPAVIMEVVRIDIRNILDA